MTIYTLPKLAAALGVGYSTVYSLRARGFLQPTQVNGSQEYYTLDDYKAAAERSVEEWRERNQHFARPMTASQQQKHRRIDYDALFSACHTRGNQ